MLILCSDSVRFERDYSSLDISTSKPEEVSFLDANRHSDDSHVNSHGFLKGSLMTLRYKYKRTSHCTVKFAVFSTLGVVLIFCYLTAILPSTY